MKIKNWFLDVLKGGSLGLGMIPGVSAGTMALIVGIYDRLIGGIANLRKEFKKSLISLIPIGIGLTIFAVIGGVAFYLIKGSPSSKYSSSGYVSFIFHHMSPTGHTVASVFEASSL